MNKTDYPFWSTDTIRYADADAQGHVNNAVFSTFFETGRTQFLLHPNRPSRQPGMSFVIAKLVLDFKAEMRWPGEAHIGTRCKSIGRSSFVMEQVIVQNDAICAVAETVMVMMDDETRKSAPLPELTIARLKEIQTVSS